MNLQGRGTVVAASISHLEAVPRSTPHQKEQSASCQALLTSSTIWGWTRQMREPSYSMCRSATYREAQALMTDAQNVSGGSHTMCVLACNQVMLELMGQFSSAGLTMPGSAHVLMISSSFVKSAARIFRSHECGNASCPMFCGAAHSSKKLAVTNNICLFVFLAVCFKLENPIHRAI